MSELIISNWKVYRAVRAPTTLQERFYQAIRRIGRRANIPSEVYEDKLPSVYVVPDFEPSENWLQRLQESIPCYSTRRNAAYFPPECVEDGLFEEGAHFLRGLYSEDEIKWVAEFFGRLGVVLNPEVKDPHAHWFYVQLPILRECGDMFLSATKHLAREHIEGYEKAYLYGRLAMEEHPDLWRLSTKEVVDVLKGYEDELKDSVDILSFRIAALSAPGSVRANIMEWYRERSESPGRKASSPSRLQLV